MKNTKDYLKKKKNKISISRGYTRKRYLNMSEAEKHNLTENRKNVGLRISQKELQQQLEEIIEQMQKILERLKTQKG